MPPRRSTAPTAAAAAVTAVAALASLMMSAVVAQGAAGGAGEELPGDCNPDRTVRPALTPELASLRRAEVPGGVRVDVSLVPGTDGAGGAAAGEAGVTPASFPLVVVRSGGGAAPRDVGAAVGALLAQETRSFAREFIPSVTAKLEKLLRESKYDELTRILPGWCVRARSPGRGDAERPRPGQAARPPPARARSALGPRSRRPPRRDPPDAAAGS